MGINRSLKGEASVRQAKSCSDTASAQVPIIVVVFKALIGLFKFSTFSSNGRS